MNTAGGSVQPLSAGASSLGLRVLLLSIAALFMATLFCGWYFRDTGNTGEALPALPLGIWASSVLLIVVSAFGERAARTLEVRWVDLSGVIAFVFLLWQGAIWVELLEQETGDGVHPMYAFNFYLMTVLHAVHILGGIVYALVVSRNIRRDAPEGDQGARNLAQYWHFLLGTWGAIVLNLLAIRIENPEDSFLSPLSLGVSGLLLLGVLGYQAKAIHLLWGRGEKAFAFFALLLPFAYLHIWARNEELGTSKMALRWGFLQGFLLIALMFTGTLHLGRFAGNYEEISY
ncbi:MAG: hypothetical protein ACPG31_06385 [Planctomycetota bacterium]